MKYQNKDGISLNYTSDDVHTKLVKEVINKSIRMLEDSIAIQYENVIDTVDFLKENFDIGGEDDR